METRLARRAMLGLVGGGAALLFAGCGLVTNYRPFRFRATVEVETPKGLRTGSSVIEVEAGEVGTTLGGGSAEARGEAIAVDIAPGQTMFVLLDGDDPYDWALGVMFGVTPTSDDQSIPGNDRFRARLEAVRANKKLNAVPRWFPPSLPAREPISGYPTMVRFRDISDPTTVEEVDPDNLAASFGSGIKLRRITVQLTDDPITTGIVKRLPWLPNQKLGLVPHSINVPIADWPFGARIHPMDFAKGTL